MSYILPSHDRPSAFLITQLLIQWSCGGSDSFCPDRVVHLCLCYQGQMRLKGWEWRCCWQPQHKQSHLSLATVRGSTDQDWWLRLDLTVTIWWWQTIGQQNKFRKMKMKEDEFKVGDFKVKIKWFQQVTLKNGCRWCNRKRPIILDMEMQV